MDDLLMILLAFVIGYMFKNMCVKRVEGLTQDECMEFQDLYKTRQTDINMNDVEIAETTASLRHLQERKGYYQAEIDTLINKMDMGNCPNPSPVGSLN